MRRLPLAAVHRGLPGEQIHEGRRAALRGLPLRLKVGAAAEAGLGRGGEVDIAGLGVRLNAPQLGDHGGHVHAAQVGRQTGGKLVPAQLEQALVATAHQAGGLVLRGADQHRHGFRDRRRVGMERVSGHAAAVDHRAEAGAGVGQGVAQRLHRQRPQLADVGRAKL